MSERIAARIRDNHPADCSSPEGDGGADVLRHFLQRHARVFWHRERLKRVLARHEEGDWFGWTRCRGGWAVSVRRNAGTGTHTNASISDSPHPCRKNPSARRGPARSWQSSRCCVHARKQGPVLELEDGELGGRGGSAPSSAVGWPPGRMKSHLGSARTGAVIAIFSLRVFEPKMKPATFLKPCGFPERCMQEITTRCTPAARHSPCLQIIRRATGFTAGGLKESI